MIVFGTSLQLVIPFREKNILVVTSDFSASKMVKGQKNYVAQSNEWKTWILHVNLLLWLYEFIDFAPLLVSLSPDILVLSIMSSVMNGMILCTWCPAVEHIGMLGQLVDCIPDRCSHLWSICGIVHLLLCRHECKTKTSVIPMTAVAARAVRQLKKSSPCR